MSDLYSLIEFSNKLDQQIQTSSTFFGLSLLNLINSVLHFPNLLYTIYDHGLCIGAEGINKSRNLVDLFVSDFSRKDMVAGFITSTLDLSNEDCFAVRGSDILSADPFREKEHISFLAHGDLSYTASIPINDTFRIAIHKDIIQGDFSDREIEVLAAIRSLLSKKYKQFIQFNERQQSKQLIDHMLNELQIGYITIDESNQIIEYNTYMACVLKTVFSFQRLDSSVQHLKEVMNNCSQLDVKNFTILKTRDAGVDENGYVKEYYCFTAQADSAKNEGVFVDYSNVLTMKELQVLDLFAKGHTTTTISKELYISDSTVKTHLKNIYRKLGVKNQREMLYQYNRSQYGKGKMTQA